MGEGGREKTPLVHLYENEVCYDGARPEAGANCIKF